MELAILEAMNAAEKQRVTGSYRRRKSVLLIVGEDVLTSTTRRASRVGGFKSLKKDSQWDSGSIEKMTGFGI